MPIPARSGARSTAPADVASTARAPRKTASSISCPASGRTSGLSFPSNKRRSRMRSAGCPGRCPGGCARVSAMGSVVDGCHDVGTGRRQQLREEGMRWILRRTALSLAEGGAEADSRTCQRLKWVRQGRTLVARARVGMRYEIEASEKSHLGSGVDKTPRRVQRMGLPTSGTSQDFVTTCLRTSLYRHRVEQRPRTRTT